MEIPVTREDLAVLVAMLQHEHFPYNDRGAAAARALKALEHALALSTNSVELALCVSCHTMKHIPTGTVCAQCITARGGWSVKQ